MTKHTPLYAQLLEEIRCLPMAEKISKSSGFNLSEYLDSNPQALAEMGRFVGTLDAGLTDDRLMALHHWATTLGMPEVVLIKEAASGQLNVIFKDIKNQPMAVIGECPEIYESITGAVNDRALQDILDTEKRWIETGEHAPVILVKFSGQGEAENGDIIGSHEEDRWDWDGTRDLFALSLDERNAACERDSYESDQLRDSDLAHECAREWNGPFMVSVSVCRPSEKLISLRQAAQLEFARPNSGPTAVRTHRI